MKHRKVCMLGGSGFVGRHIAARLASHDVDVRVITRFPHRAQHLTVLPNVELVSGNCHDPDTLRRHFQGCDAVINLVGILNENRRQSFRQVHVELVRKVLDACTQTGVRRLIHQSALNADAGGPSEYLRTRGEAEGLIQVHQDRGLATTIFQPSTIFGSGDSFTLRFAGLLKLMPGIFPLACPDSKMAPVFVGDVAEAHVRALDDRRTFGKRYQLCGPDVMSLQEIVRYLARVQGTRRWVLGLGPRLSKLQGIMMQMVPGKPFSVDNFNSLQKDAVCSSNGLAELGIQAQGMDAIVPTYLGEHTIHHRYDDYRRLAGRE